MKDKLDGLSPRDVSFLRHIIKTELNSADQYMIKSFIREGIQREIERSQIKVDFGEEFQEKLREWIKEEVRCQICDNSIHKYTEDMIIDKIKTQFNTICKDIANVVLSRMNKELRREYAVTKKLCYSIESEIKHTLQRLPTTVEHDEKIRDIISNFDVGQITQLEDKRGEGNEKKSI